MNQFGTVHDQMEPNSRKPEQKSVFFHLSNFKMLQNSVGISDFYMLHVAARD